MWCKLLLACVVAICATLFYQRRSEIQHYVNAPGLRESYDYIVVGAGSAGSVLANRLSSALPNRSVLLIEAGTEPSELAKIPAYAAYLQDTDHDWQYITEPQKQACLSMIEKRSAWPQGKCLGGTSSINWMIYHRGFPADYDHWAALGNKGWSYKDVLPYFVKSEKVFMPELADVETRGKHGPLNVNWVPQTDFGRAMLEAAKTAGIPVLKDYVSQTTPGFGRMQQVVNKGQRQGVFWTYLKPVLDRSNLHVLTDAHVTKVLFGGHRAIGVEFATKKALSETHELKQVFAKNEVILSAGAIGSPRILLQSGVGPSDHLQNIGIPIVKHLPAVGQNLVDHVFTDLNFEANQSIGLDSIEMRSRVGSLKAQLNYHLFKSAPLNSTPIEIMGNFISGLLPNDPRPDFQILGFPGAGHVTFLPETVTKLKAEDALRAYEFGLKSPAVAMSVGLWHPKSSGYISLRTADPLEYPIIEPNYHVHEIDVEVLLRGIQMILTLVKQPAFQKYGLKFAEKPIHGCEKHEFLSDDYFRCHIRHRTATGYHPACTCRMGVNETDSVVGSNLRVHGLQSLRVVDTSVYPDHISGNTNAPTIMIAEKIAEETIRDEQTSYNSKTSYGTIQ